MKWLYQASIAGHVRAQYQLALCLHRGRGVDFNLQEAVSNFFSLFFFILFYFSIIIFYYSICELLMDSTFDAIRDFCSEMFYLDSG